MPTLYSNWLRLWGAKIGRLAYWSAGTLIADTHQALRVLETFGAPVYYVPPKDVRMELLEPESGSSFSSDVLGKAISDFSTRQRRYGKTS